MLGLVRGDKSKFEKEISEATSLLREGRGEEIMSEWVWEEYPISARSYLSLFADNSKDAIFNFYDSKDALERLSEITIPTYAVMGRSDDALTVSIEETFARLETALAKSVKVKTEILGDANHGYRGHEKELAEVIKQWIVGVE